MNPLNEFRQFLADAGFSDTDADRIARLRLSQTPRRLGTITAAKNDDGDGEVEMYDVIGFDWSGNGMTPRKLADQLKEMGPVGKLTVRINSPGGDVFDAMTILNILRRQDTKVAVEVEGLAASAASIIAQVADKGELKISEGGMFMIHRAWSSAAGNCKELLAVADLLEKLDTQIAGVYASRSGRKPETWLKLMEDETWFTGAEAVEHKLADATVPTKRAAACVDAAMLGDYRNVPLALAASVLVDTQQRNAKIEAEQREREAAAVKLKLRLLEIDNSACL